MWKPSRDRGSFEIWKDDMASQSDRQGNGETIEYNRVQAWTHFYEVTLMIQCHAFSVAIDFFSTLTCKSQQGEEHHEKQEPTDCSRARSRAWRQKEDKEHPSRKGNQNSNKRIQIHNHGDCVAHLQHKQEQVCHAIHGVTKEGGESEPPPFVHILVMCASPGLVVLLASAFLALAFLLNCSTMVSQFEAILGLNEV